MAAFWLKLTLRRLKSKYGGTSRQHAAPDAVQLRARRSPRMIALGVLLTVMGGLIAAFLYTNSTTSQSVLVMSRNVQRGEVITAGDLVITTVGAIPGVVSTPAEKINEIVDKTALVDLPQGSLIGVNSVGSPVVPEGTAQVGLRLGAGRVPMYPMPAGAKVLLVEIADENKPGRTFKATLVSAPKDLGDGVTLLVDVRVDQKQAPDIAALSAHDKLALVRQAD
ncbi:MAG: flagellar biosynthesis protein FlgA [Propionibacterium sp.]|nr:MAG: flagellar biosynthesis protein FlgA [Propionibacterium sp.]